MPSLALTTITNSIAALSVSGVTILDIDQIYPDMSRASLPVLFPEPLNFVKGLRVERNSQGAGGSALKTVYYNLTYTFLFAPLGTDRALVLYDDFVTKAFLILDAIITNDAITGLVDIQPLEPPIFGLVADPAGNQYFGCQFVFQVMEFWN